MQVQEIKPKFTDGANFRSMVYAYLPITTLLSMISHLSKKERELLINNNLMKDSNIKLVVRLDKDRDVRLESLHYALQIC